ncbi:cupin domain-containing protein [Hydrogenophaga sp.]|uniref:cupin domain-containing protein n=1 Tax=Hydrogenophaga sp. TaxID=1904254 RepID=UPI002719538A|nr:cupin domain-containing protein [Hydrogenophaga sp.]MDO9435151.1 cupin domain-containing protein [Hydrogenophaga sp.]
MNDTHTLSLETLTPTPEEMEKRIARLKDLQPTKRNYSASNDVGVPGEIYAKLAAHSVFKLMSPPGNKRSAAIPAVSGVPGLEVSILDNPPGHGPRLHAHMKTVECFLCLTGRYKVAWGSDGEHEVFLDPFDFIAVPPRVFREVTNVSDSNALVLAIMQGGIQDAFNDLLYAPSLGQKVEAEYGPQVVKNFANLGVTFGTVWHGN